MSQVIQKLQSGGSFTIDGIKYDATPEFINALTTHLRDTAGTDAQTLAGLSKALQNGQDLSYDSSANTISGMDGIWSGITHRQNERRKAGSSNWRKFWEAQFDTDAHRFRNALSAIGSFHYQVPKETEEVKTPEESSSTLEESPVKAEIETSSEPAIDKQRWIAGGHEGLMPLLGQRAIVNDDGSISLKDGESWGWNLGELNGRNIWFNDDFYNSTYGADGTFEPLRGYTLYNNRLYALNNPTLANILNADGGFNTMKKAGDWTGADNLILTRFTESNRENPASLNADAYSTFLSGNPNYRFSDLTGLSKLNDMVDGDQLIQYVDLDEDSLVGPYRNYGYKYAILDNRGNLKRDNITKDEVEAGRISGGSARTSGLNTYKQIVGDQGKYTGRYYEDLIDSNGNATGFRVYTDKNNSDDIILHMPEITASGVQEQDIVVPKDVASILFRDKSVWDNIIGNAQNKKNFMSIMSSLVRSHFSPNNNTWVPFVLNSTVKRQLKNLGFKDQELNDLVEAFKTARKGSKSERRENYLVNQPQFKEGGVIKEQTGGVAGGAKTSTGVTEHRVNATNTTPKNSAAVLGDSKNWTDADTADVAALLADLGSLGAAFVPGANIASAATGAAGSTARLYADLNRGTKGAGWNYLVNLGMDAATLLPFAGGAANSAKVIRAVKKSLPTIIKAASVYGLGAGVVDAANKIASGQKFTVRDVDMVVNALTAGVGLGKSGGLGKSTKTSKTKAYSENLKLGDTEVKLGDSEIKSILKASDQPKALRDAIKKQAPKASDKDIADAAEKLLKPKGTLWQKIRGNDGDIVLNVKKKPTKTEIKVKPTGNKLHDWWYGVGLKQRAYNLGLQGRPQKEFIIETGTGGFKKIPSFNETYVAGPMDSGSIITKGADQLKLNPYFMKNRALYELAGKQHFYVPKIIPNTMANKQQNVDTQPSGAVMQPLFKEGGKIAKAELGINTDKLKLNLNILKPDLNTSFKPKVNPVSVGSVNAPKLPNLFKAPTAPTFTKIGDIGKLSVTNPMTGKAAVDTRTSKQIDSAIVGDEQGTFSAEKWIPDLNPVGNILRAAIASKQSDNQLKNFLDRPQFQHQDLQLNAPRYINSGTGDAYRNQSNQLRLFKPTTSDALQNDLMARDRQREALQSELQGNLADSQEFGQYKANLDAFINDLRLKQYNIADTNSQLRWQHAIEDVQAKNANIAEKSKFWDQAGYSLQDWYNRNWQTRGAIESQRAYTKDLAELDAWYRDQMLAHNAKYKDDLNSDAAAQSLASINSQLALRKNSLGNSGYIAQLSPMFKRWFGYKNGGKVGSGKRSAMTYSRDPYPELLLQNAKDSTEIVKQLNDAVIKLLLQTKPINVH